MAVMKGTGSTRRTCPLCGNDINHETELLFAQNQGFVSRFGRVVEIFIIRLRILMEVLARFPGTLDNDRLYYLIHDDEDRSEAVVAVQVCYLNKVLEPLGIKLRSKSKQWSVYFLSREETLKIPCRESPCAEAESAETESAIKHVA